MEEGDVSADSGNGATSESAGEYSEEMIDVLVDDRVFEEALFAGDLSVGFAEEAFSDADYARSGFSSPQTYNEDEDYAREARALVDAHDAAQDAVRAADIAAAERAAAEFAAAEEHRRHAAEARRGREVLRNPSAYGSIFNEVFGSEEGVEERGHSADVPVQTASAPSPSAPIDDGAIERAPVIEAPSGFTLGGHRPGIHAEPRGAFREITDYDASGFGSMDEFADDDEKQADPIAFRGLRWIRRNVGNLKVTVSLQRGSSPRDRKNS